MLSRISKQPACLQSYELGDSIDDPDSNRECNIEFHTNAHGHFDLYTFLQPIPDIFSLQYTQSYGHIDVFLIQYEQCYVNFDTIGHKFTNTHEFFLSYEHENT